eukprot:3599236-Lingulodinium_polyedra.AAC.1
MAALCLLRPTRLLRVPHGPLVRRGHQRPLQLPAAKEVDLRHPPRRSRGGPLRRGCAAHGRRAASGGPNPTVPAGTRPGRLPSAGGGGGL